jgi:EpsD family peptidyl-prolyl cis-trans isomerase
VPTGDAKRRAAQLDAFVSEQLLANAALRAGLDKTAAVTAAGEGERRQALARAYLVKKAAALGPIRSNDIERYYARHPELFAQRRIYRLQEIVVTAPPDRVAEVIARFATLDTFQKRRDWLESMQLPFTVGVAVLAAEDLPADMLVSIARLPEGSVFNVRSDQGVTAIQITGLEEKPLTLAQARTAIERFLTNQRSATLAEREVQRLRRAAKIEYFPPYVKPKPG